MHGLQKHQSDNHFQNSPCVVSIHFASIGHLPFVIFSPSKSRSLWPTNNLRRAAPEASSFPVKPLEFSSQHRPVEKPWCQVMVQGIISQRPSCKKQRSNCLTADVAMFLDVYLFFTGDGADGVAATTKCSSTGGSNEPEVARINRENCGCLVKILSWHHCWKSKVPFPFSHCQGLLRGRTTIETSRCKRVSLRRTLSLDICRGSCRGPSVVWQGNSHEEIVKH